MGDSEEFAEIEGLHGQGSKAKGSSRLWGAAVDDEIMVVTAVCVGIGGFVLVLGFGLGLGNI